MPPALWRNHDCQPWEHLSKCYEVDKWSSGISHDFPPSTPFPEHLKPKHVKELEKMKKEALQNKGGEVVQLITVLQPYAHYIIHGSQSGFKDIENRVWQSNYRGRLYIHAGQKWYEDPADVCATQKIIDFMDSQCGYIIGYVDMIDCVDASDSPWFFGPFGFVVRNPVALDEPIKVAGRQRIWSARVKVA
jgi:hypothetical protein